ncbi:hypothetical protein MNB_SM-4-957 [hydrothermal vent metagenome]|uniref:Uncharacterized protein n=1 Tax=hydrothermal vent metagenome TaxID=652676 RepID=A0A1W1C642_9ZZZZ
MIYIGMIFQYNTDTSSGLIMLSDGGQKSFTSDDWVDTTNTPTVGQKIAYIDDANTIQVRVACEADMNNKPEEKKELKSVDEHVAHFTSLGFKLIKDANNDGTRVLTLRSFATGESEEVVIKEKASNISVVRTHNGKVVT